MFDDNVPFGKEQDSESPLCSTTCHFQDPKIFQFRVKPARLLGYKVNEVRALSAGQCPCTLRSECPLKFAPCIFFVKFILLKYS